MTKKGSSYTFEDKGVGGMGSRSVSHISNKHLPSFNIQTYTERQQRIASSERGREGLIFIEKQNKVEQ